MAKKTGPQNVIPDNDFGTELPVTVVDENQLAAEKNMARFSKSREFKQLKEYMEAKIKFYQTYLPGGDEVGLTKKKVTAEDWRVANRVIAELRAVLSAYESAEQAVKNAK